jgi:ATP-dependent Clp protease ATP-binding subunit ClpA
MIQVDKSDIIEIDGVIRMLLCKQCKKNAAVIFMTKIENGKQTQEGLCLKCARKSNIGPINQLFDNSGMSDEELDALNDQMGEFMKNMTPEMMGDMIKNMGQSDNMLSNIFPGDDSYRNNNNNNDDDIPGSKKTRVKEKKKEPKKKFLDMFGSNLNEKAIDDQIDRIIGRQKEIDRVIQILNRRTKNNPVLVGDPGVGKTAIAEGLAVKIVNGDVPAKLLKKEIYLLDLTALVAGTQFRGQFESRMKAVIKEATESGNIILVIDELHNIMGAGEAEGAMNAANILKPALAKGQVQVIGSTTLKEYRKHIEKDSALERRFQPVMVAEPSIDDTIEILKGIKDYYEAHHKVIIPDDVIETAVILSERYISDRFLPDKVIDVIDEACSRVNLNDLDLNDLERLRIDYEEVQDEKQSAVSADSIEEYRRAAEHKMKESRISQQIRDIEKTYKPCILTEDDIAAVIEQWVNIPVSKLTQIQSEKLINLESELHKRIIGQDRAVRSLAKAIRRTRSGIKKTPKPASFMFVGPTGVGKTELVKTLATELFGSTDALIRLDMSEFMEKHTVSKLIGSPPGYVGYDEAGQLTEKVRRRPYSVILFDEIEKAHYDVFNILLQIMDDGRLTDSHGRAVDFSNTIVVMTSNAGTNIKTGAIGFGNESVEVLENKAMDALKSIFRLEFLNRIDDIIVFENLTRDELMQIVRLQIDDLQRSLGDKHVVLEVSDEAVEYILEDGYDVTYGARPIKRSIQKLLEDELSEAYIRGELKDRYKVEVTVEDKKLKYGYVPINLPQPAK